MAQGFAIFGGLLMLLVRFFTPYGDASVLVVCVVLALLWAAARVGRLGSAQTEDVADFENASPQRLLDQVLMARVRFDATGWTYSGEAHGRWVWHDSAGTGLVLVCRQGSLGPVENDTDVVSYCRGIIEFHSSLVDARPLQSESFRGLVCIQKAERPPGYAYTGRLHVLLDEQTVVFFILAFERGVTGVREALVTAEALRDGRIAVGAPGTKVKGWFVDFHDPTRANRTICSIADDEQYDERFPAHPLSRVRSALRQIEGSFEIRPSGAPRHGDPWPHQPLGFGYDSSPTIH